MGSTWRRHYPSIVSRPAKASIVVPGRAVEVEQLWYDRTRWASWIDGFGHVVSLDDGWPQTGARLQWDSRPGGPGRVIERVTRYEPRLGQTIDFEDAAFTGVRRVTFEPGLEQTRITLEVEPTPKLRVPPARMWLFRRRLGDSLRRTLLRFSYELAAERQFGRDR
jgi:Polyketide cyclase / dehydrase and lipid transport